MPCFRREVFPSFCATFFCDWALVNLAVSGGRAPAATRRRRARAEAAEAGDDGSVITLVAAKGGREGREGKDGTKKMMEVTFLPQLVPLLPYMWPSRLLSRRSCGSQDLTRSNRFLLRHLFRPSLHPRSPSLVVDGTEMGICCCGESGRRQRERPGL